MTTRGHAISAFVTAAITVLLPGVLAAEDLKPIFDGQSLDGWEALPEQSADAHWKVAHGCIVAENPDKKGSNLWTVKQYRDYELELQYKTPSDYYDSGVMVRGPGHQVQIGISGSLQIDLTACIYAPKDKDPRGKYPVRSDKIESVHKAGQWNHLRILMTGKRIQTFLNGTPMVDYTGVVISDEGPIGLQLHSGHHMKMLFKNVKLRELESETDSGA
jgi:hypothetical protein